MGLKLRFTFNDNDYVYEIVNSKLINQHTNEFEVVLNGDKLALVRNEKMVWVQKDGTATVDPELANALGRSVALRLRM